MSTSAGSNGSMASFIMSNSKNTQPSRTQSKQRRNSGRPYPHGFERMSVSGVIHHWVESRSHPAVAKPSARSQVERAPSVVIRRGGPDGDTPEQEPDQARLAGPLRLHGCARGPGRARQTHAEPGSGPSTDHQ